MALTWATTDFWDDGKRLHIVGTLTASGNYATGGDAVDFQAVITDVRGIRSQPSWVEIRGKAGYVYEYDYTNKKVMARQEAAAANPADELSAAAYPAGVTGDTIRAYVVVKKFV